MRLLLLLTCLKRCRGLYPLSFFGCELLNVNRVAPYIKSKLTYMLFLPSDSLKLAIDALKLVWFSRDRTNFDLCMAIPIRQKSYQRVRKTFFDQHLQPLISVVPMSEYNVRVVEDSLHPPSFVWRSAS